MSKDEIIVDLCNLDSEAVICKGGKGGLGNCHFASALSALSMLK